MTFKEFVKSLNNNEAEGELVKTIIYSVIASALMLGLLYLVKLKDIPEFFPKYGLYIFLSMISFSFIAGSVKHVKNFKGIMCMSGMMVGMTIGMISGFLAGAYTGAINGMFFGRVFGMAVGILIGVWTGKCCGIMGIMEGAMAGFMGGLMGAMTSLMLLNDHLKYIIIISFLICSSILFGLSYMIYTETREAERKQEGYFVYVSLAVLLTYATTLFIIFGPRGGIFA